MASYSPNPFDTLPIETNQHIASFLETDTELCHYRAICRAAYDAVEADRCSFWRRKFLSHFEKPSWAQPNNNVRFKQEYQRRRNVLKNGAAFKVGATSRERACLEVLRDLINDSFSSKTNTSDQIYESHNLNKLKKFLTDNNILQIIFKPVANRSGRYNTTIPSIPTPLLYTIQVVAAPMLLSFDPHIADYHFGFPDSQAIVYSTPTAWPIFTGCHGLDINMPFILHNLNFWKYHMVREVENTLFNAFADLDDDERPRWWSTQPKQGEHALGKRWKGSYAFVDREDIDTMRRGLSDDADPIQDQFAGEDACFSFQNMKLELADEGKELPWPQMFEKELRSLTPAATRARTRAQKRCATPDAIANFKPQSFRFDGEGLDVAEQFFASGWLNPLPPQSGIPGWRRMTMMKYFEHEFDAGVIDPEGLWAYEGVVLPGGQIMLGRWWSVDDGVDGQYSGPFILWCVDGPKYEDAAETKVGKEEFEDVGRP